MKTIAEPSEPFFDFSMLGNQIRLLISPCRDLHSTTFRKPIGQSRRDGKTTFPENRPGSLLSPHINGAENNGRYFILLSTPGLAEHLHNDGYGCQ
jgi:hypothetical protein